MTKSVPSVKPAPEPEHKLHPAGDFDAKFLEWGEIKQSQNTERMMWFMHLKLKTEHGVVYAAVNGLPDALTMLRKSAPYYEAYSAFKIRVQHVQHGGQTFARTDVRWNETEI